MAQKFGGNWTEQKLDVVRKYLEAYIKLMTRNQRAQFLRKIYLDGFAGSGHRQRDRARGLFTVEENHDFESLWDGSASKALSVRPSFDRYIFVEASAKNVEGLEQLRTGTPELASRIEIVHEDINVYIPKFSQSLSDKDRALVFLDPFGMEVNWATLQSLASTKKCDVWVLVPLGQAIVRLLTQNSPPPREWAAALTRFFGTDDWRSEFYTVRSAPTLFGEDVTAVRDADFQRITDYVVRRLGSIFAAVLQKPAILRNSKGCPLYLLCFAVSNEKAITPAIRIATHITRGLASGI